MPHQAELPIVLIPGLACSPRLFAPQLATLWQFGPVTIANTRQDDSIAGLAQRILASAPPRFVLLGLSMGGYIALEILRQAPERVIALAVLDSSARPDNEEAVINRKRMIALAQEGKLPLATEMNFPRSVHPAHQNDQELLSTVLLMAQETGVESYVRQQTAIMHRIDSRPTLASINCPTLILVGDEDQLTPPAFAQEMAQGIEHAQLHIIPQSGHLSTLEQPETVSRVLYDWLWSIHLC